jgi:hypothetical protein
MRRLPECAVIVEMAACNDMGITVRQLKDVNQEINIPGNKGTGNSSRRV